MELRVVITANGHLHYVHDDALLGVQRLGRANIRRASHVEPDAAGLWRADLSPCGGPTLGPFARRADALAAERTWIERHLQSQ